MKSIIFLSLMLFGFLLSKGQKRPLDYAAIDSWPRIENEKISGNGNFILYTISSKLEGPTLVIQAIKDPRKKLIKGGKDGVFSDDDKRVIFRTASDSLAIVELNSLAINVLDKISSFRTLSAGNGQWVIYQAISGDSLVTLNLSTGGKTVYPRTTGFEFSVDGCRLVLHQKCRHFDIEMDSVAILDMNTGGSHFVWSGSGATNWTFDRLGSQVAFLKEDAGGNEIQLWHYKLGLDSAILLAKNADPSMQGYSIAKGEILFSPDGNNIFFKIRPLVKERGEDSPKKQNNYIIWSYRDNTLNTSTQIPVKEFEAVINLRHQTNVVKIETTEDEQSYSSFRHCYSNDKVLLRANLVGPDWESSWRTSARPDLYLVSTVDGTRKLLARNCLVANDVGFSPIGRYVWWFDRERRHWFTYNLLTGAKTNVSLAIPISLINTDQENAGDHSSYGMAGWFENDSAMFLFDKYDIWKVDPNGALPPKNFTLGYGRKHHTVLRPIEFNTTEFTTFGDQVATFTSKDTLTLYTFDKISKLNGFAQIPLNGHNGLITLIKRPINYYGVTQSLQAGDPNLWFSLKAAHANAYIFKPTRDTVYPNLCLTKDFINFKQLTDLAPQKKYNWYSDELIHWKGSDGRINSGILFKPEDFDSKNKYPLIVFIYETFSDGLNVFLTPQLCRGDMEVLWYVSHHYLVLLPDIHYVIGHPGASAYNSVITAVHYLSRSNWVDVHRLGLQGHSFGGYETNYIITRTHIFAAASSASAVSDLISESGQLLGGTGWQGFFEMGQGRMGTTLWRRPDLYIHQSPIFNADSVTTPLLIVHNPRDNSVYFSQAVEWFTGLRRLGKKAWMLQYPNEEHIIWDEMNELDYSIRLNQFFDHFLKGTPAPQWMRGEESNFP